MRQQPQGAKRNIRQRPKPNQKEIFPSTKDNLLTCRKCSAGGLANVSTIREAQWRDPITCEDTQPQRGPPGKKAPAAAGRKEEPLTEAPTPSGRI